MTPTLRRVTRLFGTVLVAMAPVLATASAAQAQTAVTYNLQSSALGQTANSTLPVQVSGSAPASVPSGGALSVALSVGSITVPTSASGYTIKQIQDIDLKLPVPTDATYVSSSLSGGSGFGGGTPSVSVSGGVIDILVPGPIAAGTTFTLPTLTLQLTAGASGGTITSTLSGTSYSDPGLTFTAVLSVFGFSINAGTVGYPTTLPTLTSTSIS